MRFSKAIIDLKIGAIIKIGGLPMWWRYSVLFAGLLALALYASNPSIDSFRKYCHQNIEAQSGPLSAMFTNLSLWISEKSILY